MTKDMVPGVKVAVVGVTGAVGAEMVAVLHDRKFPLTDLRLFASARSAGKTLETPFGSKTIEEFTVDSVAECDIALLAVSGDFSKEYAPQLAARGVTVIDNSSAFRYDDDKPLVVPEINPHAIGDSKIIANPNCTTAILVVALAPLHKEFGIKRVIVSTYQAASGAGAEGMKELEDETRAALNGGQAGNKVFAHPLPFNVIPHIDKFQDNGYTKEEMKVTWETRKIMGLPDLPVSCTAVRIPILRAHSEAATIETEKPVDVARARAVLGDAPGVKLVDDTANNVYPMPLNASGKYDVEVGRIRKNAVFGDNGLDLFVSGDQLLKGAALNAVQIAECVVAGKVR
ncbi:aspartate-semialdehyde dehydrogenase [Caenispirillum bisanense]|uniref:Aspartate-semialdehyde dehydrogenase n=1 Tax=Caenispirillum bisanense TaxID=414052 RepID=A0A286GYI3_9PROT|nr:aspartate-semialdehyde dehydrogenase [Caenispirillum bisanense]SOE00568.1 aspartate semialdehyde dehydrogenase [Caenispirillum bisanense]